MAGLYQKFLTAQVPALIPICLTILSICLAILSFYLVVKNYRRKSGAYIRGSFTPCSSRYCNDEYVHEVVLENLKDRSVTIFGIYLRFGYNNYLEIEDFDDTPLTLKPFETYVKSYGPIEFYSMNCQKIAVNGLFNREVKKTLFLATSDGKYKVKAPVWHWNPIDEYFSNHFTAVIHPVRTTHRGSSIGGNMKFVVDLVNSDGSIEAIQIPADHQLSPFKHFVLTQDSLASKGSLEQFLQKQIEVAKLTCKSFTVYDLEAWRAKKNESYKGKPIEVKTCGPFRYFVLGRVFTIYDNWQVDRRNRKRVAESRQQQKPSSMLVSEMADKPAQTSAQASAGSSSGTP